MGIYRFFMILREFRMHKSVSEPRKVAPFVERVFQFEEGRITDVHELNEGVVRIGMKGQGSLSTFLSLLPNIQPIGLKNRKLFYLIERCGRETMIYGAGFPDGTVIADNTYHATPVQKEAELLRHFLYTGLRQVG
jgi:hypothetical protein